MFFNSENKRALESVFLVAAAVLLKFCFFAFLALLLFFTLLSIYFWKDHCTENWNPSAAWQQAFSEGTNIFLLSHNDGWMKLTKNFKLMIKEKKRTNKKYVTGIFERI